MQKRVVFIVAVIFPIIFLVSCQTILDRGNEIDPNSDGYLPATVNKKITAKVAGYVLNIQDVSRTLPEGSKDTLEFVPDTLGQNMEALNVNTNWDKDLGIIYISSDEKSTGPPPFATITMIYDPREVTPTSNEDFKYFLKLDVVGISLSDVLEGTAAELNYRSYDFEGATDSPKQSQVISVNEVGNNYISGLIKDLKMRRKVFKQGIYQYTINSNINLLFTACTRCD